MVSPRTSTYRIYIWPELAEPAMQKRIQPLLDRFGVDPPEEHVDWDEYFAEWINPLVTFKRERLFRVSATSVALTYLVTFSDFSPNEEKEYLESLKENQTIIAWDDPNQPPSLRWLLTVWPKQIALPNIQGYLHLVETLSYLRVPRQDEVKLYLTGIVNESGKLFWSGDFQSEREEDGLIFSLSAGQHLLFWARKNTSSQEVVATALFCQIGEEMVIEEIDGISIEIVKKHKLKDASSE